MALGLTLENWRERMRASLFFLPATFIVAALVLLLITDTVDTRLPETIDRLPLLRTDSTENTRQLLATIAGATITVAGIVFSVTVVAVQLTSSQFSPRVLHGFLRDRFDQTIMGIVVATFVYCLVALATTPAAVGAQDPGPELRHLTVTLAVGLGITSILAIVAFIDHSARAMQVGQIIRGIADDTRELIADLLPPAGEGVAQGTVDAHEPEGDGFTVRSTTDGWIQQLDHDGLLGLLPEAGTGRVEVRVGAFVAEGTPLLTVWPGPEDPEDATAAVHRSVTVGRTRTMQQDISFGLRQLVDIALRALSPGVNDPTTAYDVLANLGAVLGDLLQRDLPPRVTHGEDGRVLLRPHDLGLASYVGRTFDQIRIAGADQPAVAISMLRIIARIDELLSHVGLDDRRPPLREQARRVVESVEQERPDDEDTAHVRSVAERLGLLTELDPSTGGDMPKSSEPRTDDESENDTEEEEDDEVTDAS